MALPTVTGEFRVVADPELRFTPSGHAVANLRLVANSRKLNKNTDEWEDDKVVWLNATAWNQQAENIAESVEKGALVLVTGRLETREWTDRENNKRQSTELSIDEVGPSLRYATAKVSKAERRAAGQQSSQQAAAPAEDPWANTGAPPAAGPQPDEPPF